MTMRHQIKQKLLKLLLAGGYTKRILQRGLGAGGLNEIRGEIGELRKTLDTVNAHVVALDDTVNTRVLGQIRGPKPLFDSAAITDLPGRLDRAGGQAMSTSNGDAPELASHYATAATLVARYWLARKSIPDDPYADDDFSLEYAIAKNVFVPGEGNEVDVPPDRVTVPWRHLFNDPDCGIFLVLGQSNAANHGDVHYVPKHEVYSFDFLRTQAFRADDPLPGASGTGGSTWSRLGDLMIEAGLYKRVLFVPIAFGGAFVTDWVPGGSKHGRTTLALSRLWKQLFSAPQFSAVLWQQGEAEANHTDMKAPSYQAHFRDIVADLRTYGVFAPVFVAQATICANGNQPFDNLAEIRKAQEGLHMPSGGIFAGPDVDTIGVEDRYDHCHLGDKGLQRCAKLWLDVLAAKKDLLSRP